MLQGMYRYTVQEENFMSIRAGLSNKKTLYILLPVNLAIWDYIGYKIYAAMNDGGPDISISTSVPELSSLSAKRDSFVIFANYRDPFLNNLPGSGSHKSLHSNPSGANQNKIKNNNAPQNNTQKPPVNTNTWPEIKYIGSVTNTQASNKSVALVSIAGTTYSLKIGEEVNGIKLTGFNNDQADFKRGKEKKSVPK